MESFQQVWDDRDHVWNDAGYHKPLLNRKYAQVGTMKSCHWYESLKWLLAPFWTYSSSQPLVALVTEIVWWWCFLWHWNLKERSHVAFLPRCRLVNQILFFKILFKAILVCLCLSCVHSYHFSTNQSHNTYMLWRLKNKLILLYLKFVFNCGRL